MPTTEFPAVTEDAQARNGHVKVERRERVIVRFAGDSGDGMQLAGGRFTDATAVFGNDLATLPSFPAEIRARRRPPRRRLEFQIHFAERDIATPGDTPNVLVAMNPAALRSNLCHRSSARRTTIVNQDAPPATCRRPATSRTRSRTSRSMDRVQPVPMTTIVGRAVEGSRAPPRGTPQRARNLFALGLVSWL